MSFRDYLISDNIVDLDYDEKDAALEQLVRRLCRKLKIKDHQPILDDILKREETASTFIGSGVAIPQADSDIDTDFSVIVGRSVEGINYDAARNAKVHIVVLVVSNDKRVDEEGQIEFLAKVSTFFKDEMVIKLLVEDEVDSLTQLRQNSKKEHDENDEDEDKSKKGKKEPLISAATALARDLNAKAVMVFADTKLDAEFLKYIKTRRQVIIVTSNKSRFDLEGLKFDVIQAPLVRSSRIGQVKIGILLAMSRNLLAREDSVVCVSGANGTDRFDTVVSIDIGEEFEFFFSATRSLVPPDVKAEILERVLGIASEIGMEGREGKALGTIFVLGDTNSVNGHIAQLIINPFRGYSESERNILDPGLEETIKEFASIDGAFIITGDGVVLSAGSYLRPIISEEMLLEELPSGLGSRHAAAAGITAATNAIAITVSESTGQVTVFKNGAIALTLSKQMDK